MLAKTFTLTLLLFTGNFISAQTIEPSVLNAGGGHSSTNYLFDWSIGESTSIEFFEGSGNFMVTTGILQPLTASAGRYSFIILPWSKEEINIYPVPTHRSTEVEIKIDKSGLVNMFIVDQRGQVIQTRTFNYDYLSSNRITKFDLGNLTPGIYYLNIVLGGGPMSPIIRKGTFKIQKL